MSKTEDKALAVVAGIWIAAILANIAFWGFVVWAIVQLVQWVVAQ